MYAFTILAIPFGFLLAVIAVYPPEDRPDARRAYLKGLAAFLPLLIIQRTLGAIVPAVYGSPLLALRDWSEISLPCAAFPAFAYLAFYRFGEKLAAGSAERRLTAFYAGSISPVGLVAAIRIWERPEPYTILVQPWILGAIVLAAPRIATAIYRGYGFRAALAIAGALAASLAASLGRWLFMARLWPLAWLLAAALGAGAWFLASPELLRREYRPTER